ncbi:thiopurine S-methyltransferase [uncultured Pseudomonas sp.]|uniref:thiopurine S-methyltransferase n=1 Tax=uncultured Pseudomonas sp. TaxID=114707 RepID=UPI0026138198|nr:thiopurine S-methyltransferase [uncultured Pseudomonas sp.]
MHAEFWQARWSRSEIGFHLSEVNPYLQRYWPALELAQGAQVLVPLCGKSVDMAWLAGQGYQVIGIELAQRAVEDFFAEHGLEPQISQDGVFQVYRAGAVTIYCGDLFALEPRHVAQCSALYDRAALIALPEAMRERYVARLAELLPGSIQALLVALDYDQGQMDGPPFAVNEAQVQRLLARHWQIELLEECDVLGQNWRFLQRGLSRLDERVYRLQRQ